MAEEMQQTPPTSGDKKGLSTGAKIGIGCAGGCFLLLVIFAVILMVSPVFISRMFSEDSMPGFMENWIEKSIESDTGEDVDVDLDLKEDESTITYEDEEGETTIQYGEDLGYPDNFPSDVPEYSGAIVVGKTTTPTGSTITLESEDSYETVVAYFKNELESEGWNIVSTYEVEDTSILSYEKDERNLSLTLYESSETIDGTTFSIVYDVE